MRQVHLVSEDDYAADTDGLATAKSTLRSAHVAPGPDVLRDEVGGVGDGVGGACVCVCWLRDLTETPRLMGGVTDVP